MVRTGYLTKRRARRWRRKLRRGRMLPAEVTAISKRALFERTLENGELKVALLGRE